MIKNSHTFEIGETFKSGHIRDETYVVTSIEGDYVEFNYNVNGETLKEKRRKKEKLRLFIQSGYWKQENL